MKKTLVIGASTNPERYSNKAILMLREYGHEVVALGLKEGQVNEVHIEKEWKKFENLDTVTLYLNSKRQQEYYQYIIDLQPRRVIFNPGTENETFCQLLKQNGIACEEACTLVLLRTGQY